MTNIQQKLLLGSILTMNLPLIFPVKMKVDNDTFTVPDMNLAMIPLVLILIYVGIEIFKKTTK